MARSKNDKKKLKQEKKKRDKPYVPKVKVVMGDGIRKPEQKPVHFTPHMTKRDRATKNRRSIKYVKTYRNQGR